MKEDSLDDLQYLSSRQWKPKAAKKINGVIGELMATRGYGRQLGTQSLTDAWEKAAGRLARHSRPGNVKRGVLEVIVRSSAACQEFGFQKKRILKKLIELANDEKIRDLKFTVGAID